MGTASDRYNKPGSGFTIIEVLIVLAIAGLILLIVFLAVPALKRNSRNHLRKDMMSIAFAQVDSYRTDHAGELPQTSGEHCEYMEKYVINNKSGTSCTYDGAKNCDYLDAKPIAVCFHPDNAAHDLPSELDVVELEYGHWCNRPPHTDGTTDPIMDLGSYPLHARSKFVVWSLLETGSGTVLICMDNSGG